MLIREDRLLIKLTEMALSLQRVFTPKPIPSVQRSWNSSVQQLQESRSQGWSDCFLWTASQAPDLRFSEETNPGPLCLIPPFPKAAAWPSRLEPINSGICQSVRLDHGSKEMSYTDLARSQSCLGWAQHIGKGLWYPVGFTRGVEARLGQLPADSFVFL